MISQYIWLLFQIKMLESKEDVLFTCLLREPQPVSTSLLSPHLKAPLFVVWYSEAKAALSLEEPGHSWCWHGLTDECNYSHKAPMGEEDVTSLNG